MKFKLHIKCGVHTYCISCGHALDISIPLRILITMKLVLIMILLFSMQLSAKVTAQQVSLDVKGARLDKVLTSIYKQSGYAFVLNAKELRLARPVTASLKDVPVEAALKIIFTDQPFEYTIDEKVITLLPKGKITAKVRLLQDTIRGTVTDSVGQPLAGVSVNIMGTKQATTTNAQGRFQFNEIPEGARLAFHSLGYREALLYPSANMAVTLLPSISKLDETVVIGYGTTTQRLNTGSIGRISGEDIANQPVSNPLAALSGRIPGAVVSQSSGVPGGLVNIEVQGRNNINVSVTAEPLYIIDGVPFAPNNDATNLVGSTPLSPFALINPSDIESIEVLKDADATAIYGSRGAYGVILITTKKGMAGKTAVTASVNTGISTVTRLVDLLNTEQYLEIRREAFANDGVTPDIYNAPDLVNYDPNRYTNWQKELIGKSASTTNAQLSITGGSNNTQFAVSGGYQREDLVFRHTEPYYRGSTRFSLNHRSEDNKFQMNLSAGYGTNRTRNTIADLTNLALIMPPNYPETLDGQGNLIWEYEGEPLYYGNPYEYTKESYESSTNGITSNINLSYLLLYGLTAKVSGGYNTSNTYSEYLRPRSATDPRYDVDGSMITGDNRYKSWIIEPQIEYNKSFKAGTLHVLAGTTFQQTDNSTHTVTATGFSSDELLGSLGAAADYTLQSGTSDYRYTALFGRINYNINNRYIVNLSGRRDGSSRFGSGNRFGNFGAAGVAWIFSEESWLKDNFNFLSFGKLRSSYGITGSDKIGDYQYMETWINIANPYLDVKGLYPQRLANPNFRWESNKKLAVGLELGFIADRLLFSATYFDNRSSNHLITTPLPRITGFPSIIENFPATVQNKGWEITANANVIRKEHFSWTTNFNLTLPKNKLLDFPDIERSNYAHRYMVGKPLNLIRAYVSNGVDQETGVYTFEDLNEDGQLTIDDRIYSGYLDPKAYGGLQSQFTYKNFGLDLFFEYRNQTGRNYTTSIYTSGGDVPGFMTNVPVYVLDRWQTEGDQTDIQKLSATYGTEASNAGLIFANGQNTQAFSDASFLRFKTVNLSYNLPESILSQLKIQRLQVFARAQNLFTFTSYQGSDPEVQNLRVLPPLRTYVFGLEITL